MDLDDLLQQLQRAGTLQGSGSFTLDPRRARELLQRYRIQPHEYGLLVVQAAVRARARELRVDLEDGVTSFILHGVTWDRETLRQLPDMVLTPGPEGPLALALWIASQRKPREIRLECGGWRLSMPQRSLVEAGGQDLRLEVDERLTWKDRFFGRSPPPDARESLRTSCRETHLPVTVSGSRLQIPFDMSSCLSACLLEHPDYPSDRLPVRAPSSLNKLTSSGNFAAVIGLTENSREWNTILVVDGVSYTGPVVEHVRAVVWSSELPVDLSMSAVVQGPALQELSEQLRLVAEQLRQGLWEELSRLSEPTARRAVDFLQAGLGPGDPRLARVLELKVQLGGFDPDHLAALCVSLGDQARAQGDLETAEACYRRVLDTWPKHRNVVLLNLVELLKKRQAPPSEVEPYWREAIINLNKKLPSGNERAGLAAYFEELGAYCQSTGYPQEAEQHYIKALQLRKTLTGREDAGLRGTLYRLTGREEYRESRVDS